MANKIKRAYTGSSVLYFRVLDALGRVWNGSTFATFNTANLASYAITLPEQSATGSGYYLGDFPTAIEVAGRYDVIIFKQVGGSPAVADLFVASYEIDWDGAAILTSETCFAQIKLQRDNINAKDEYTCVWFQNGGQVDSGLVVSPQITIRNRNGSVRSGPAAMAPIGGTAILTYDALGIARLEDGEDAVVTVTATIRSVSRLWSTVVGRDAIT